MKLECVVNRSLQTILDEDVEYVIHHHHPSSVLDFPKNMKAGEGKKMKREEGRGNEGQERGGGILLLGGIMKLIVN